MAEKWPKLSKNQPNYPPKPISEAPLSLTRPRVATDDLLHYSKGISIMNDQVAPRNTQKGINNPTPQICRLACD